MPVYLMRGLFWKDWQLEFWSTVVSVFIDKKAALFDQFLLQPLFVSSRIARVILEKLRFSRITEMTVIETNLIFVLTISTIISNPSTKL